MQNDTSMQKQIQEYEAQMPPEIMNVIKSFDWKKEVRMIVNQNQLLLDVGADLEQSVYLMILGIVEIGDVFERLMEVHELPEDKAQKILTEVERQIFGPMHKKLLEVGPEEESNSSSPVSASTPASTSISQSKPMTATTHALMREEALSEIEKEPEPVIKNIPPIIDLTASKNLSQKSSAPQSGPIEPFSLSFNTSDDTKEVVLPGEINLAPITENSVEEKNPVELNLTNSTVVETDKPSMSAPTKSYAVDPYREPIG